MGKYLHCPIFRQDKFKYINPMEQYCIPTLRFPFPNPILQDEKLIISDAERESLQAFVDKYQIFGENRYDFPHKVSIG